MSVEPHANGQSVPITTGVSATFDQHIDPATVSSQIFCTRYANRQLLEPLNTCSAQCEYDQCGSGSAVQAGRSGSGHGVDRYSESGWQNPLVPFVWQFRAWTTGGSGVLGDSSPDLGDSDSFAVALDDLDGDGDLDVFVGNHGGRLDQPNSAWLK